MGVHEIVKAAVWERDFLNTTFEAPSKTSIPFLVVSPSQLCTYLTCVVTAGQRAASAVKHHPLYFVMNTLEVGSYS